MVKALQNIPIPLLLLIATTLEVSSRLQFTLKDLGYEFPRYPVAESETMSSFLRKRTDEGARRRWAGSWIG